MKAILITRCGCSRMAEVPDAWGEVQVPFISHQECITDIVPALDPAPNQEGVEVRRFIRTGMLHVPGMGNVPLYKEK